MKIPAFILIAVLGFAVSGCQECSVIDDLGNPDYHIRIVDESGDNLLFGDSATYDPEAIEFEHEREGLLEVTPDMATKSVIINFPTTRNQPEDISLRLDSNTTHQLTYNTVVFTNNKCEKEYSLSYVKLNGIQVCGSCGDSQFNDDRYIYLRL